MANTFLEAEWRKLAMANYAVDMRTLKDYLPYKTEIDSWNGICYVSLVGFLFQNTKIKGFKVPFHINFEEVNLRFYVRYYDNGALKRGVVFIKEIVPKPALTFVANTVYKEKYETMPMSHSWTTSAGILTTEYKWKKKRWNSLTLCTETTQRPIEIGSEEEFITEHYWGYTKITDLKTSEYQVEHPRWEVYPVKNYQIDVDFEDIYGHDFSFLQKETPKSVILAEGSLIKVKAGRII
ncbi:MAG: DUF2071 domain-containing protein [Chitinophagaceae bacterium]|nr:DUF2071 domain-containing protein [Chitinophagaceae bacterium]